MSGTRFDLERLQTSVGPVAQVTIGNDSGGRHPNTFGESALESLAEVLGRLRTRDWRGLLLTGSKGSFGAGADIGEFPEITAERARAGSRAGHDVFGRLRELPFPTLAAINGAALGGGLELALHCDHRTIGADVRHVGFPEVFLGLIPAWGAALVVVVLLAVVALVVARLLRAEPSTRGGRARKAVLDDEGLSAADYQARAAAARSRGDWDAVLLDSYRALAASAVERTLLTDLPGRTAHEVALALEPLFPAHASPLAASATEFDAVRYGHRRTTQARAVAAADLDTALLASRPTLGQLVGP